MVNSMRVRSPWRPRCWSSPRRSPIAAITAPVNSSPQSITSSSNGSSTDPSSPFRRITCGRPKENSKPSRRIVSARIARESSPRPRIRNESASAVRSMRSPTFRSSSFSSRSRRCRLVTYFPEVPDIGDDQLEGRVADDRGGNTLEDGVEQGPEIARDGLRIARRVPDPPRAVEDGEVEVVVAGREREEEVVDLLLDLQGARVRAVDL